MASPKISNEVLNEKIENVLEKVDNVQKTIESNYVNRDYLNLRLQPLEQSKNIVFALISLILTAFAVAVIGFFLTKK